MILIADAGNTKTDWMMSDAHGDVVSYKTVGISPLMDDAYKIGSVLKEVASFYDSVEIEKIYYFGTGCFRASMKDVMRRALKEVFRAVPVEVSDDLHGAGLALFGYDPGMVVIVGTGSNAGFMDRGEVVDRIPSLGYLLGDEGSGAHLGFAFMRELLSGKVSKALAGQFYAWHHSDKDTLLSVLYQSVKPQVFAASLLPFLHLHREAVEVQGVLESSFRALYHTMISPARLRYPDAPVGFCGSVGVMFQAELEKVLRPAGVDIHEVLGAPALALCRRLVKSHYG